MDAAAGIPNVKNATVNVFKMAKHATQKYANAKIVRMMMRLLS